VNITELEKALEPFETKLRAQARWRRRLGVKRVERPTYERYIVGPIERFNSRRNIFAAMAPGNPYGAEIRETYQRKRGVDHFSKPLSQAELDMGDRPAQALDEAVWRLCRQYHPETLPVTPPEGRFEFDGPDAAERMARLVKKVAMWLGAEIVGITEVDQRWVYSDREVPHKYAIICAVPHDRAMNETAPSHISGLAVAQTYSRLKYITTQLADFICQLGYDAAYRETLGWNPDMIIVPMALDAGMGEFSRTGRVLSPEFGINMRLKAVTTDLPLAVDTPISFGTHDFCMACENCATYCPGGAVPYGEPKETPDSVFHNPGYKKWYVDPEKCLLLWAANRKKWITCGGKCIAVCPWNQPMTPFHNAARWLAIHSPGVVKTWLAWAYVKLYRPSKRIDMAGTRERDQEHGS
jgi:ferredoxin